MATYYECKVRYSRTTEDGTQKEVTEQYLVDAMSCTEAEERVTEAMMDYGATDLEVSATKKCSASDILFHPGDDKWWSAKVKYITLDEKSGKEKFTSATYIVQAKDINTALHVISETLGRGMTDYTVAGLTETKIINVIEHE